jgi:NADH-quinone oxidoreductase subunit J
MAALAFYIFSGFLLTSGVAVIFSRNPVHSVLFLILGFFNAAGLFILLGAEFLAMILVIVYVGAVAVLFLFVVMMLDIRPRKEALWFTTTRWKFMVKGLRELAYYLAIWLPVFSGFFYGMSWIGTQISGIGAPFLIQSFLPTAFAPFIAHQEIPQVMVIVSTVLLFASLFFASSFTVTVTRVSIFQAVDHLLQGIPTPLVVGIILAAEFLVVLMYWGSNPLPLMGSPAMNDAASHLSNTHALAPVIYRHYVFAFLMSGLILLVAMIGAIVLTLRKRPDVRRQDINRQLARRKENTLEIRKVKVGEGI